MRAGMGMLRWSPDTFWNATLPELVAAADGYRLAHGEEVDFDVSFGRRDLERLMALYPDDQPRH